MLSTLPAITTNPTLNTLIDGTTAGTTGNQVDPSVAIDPTNPTKMVAVWVQDAPGEPFTTYNGTSVTQYIEAAYSTNSGTSWTPLGGSLGNNVANFSVTSNIPPLPNVTDATVAFDGNGNFYIADEAHTADFTVGQLTTERFSFATATPTQTLTDNVVRQWNGLANALFKPILAADGNRTTANGQTDPGTAFTPITGGPFGAVYITASTAQDTASPVNENSHIDLLTSIDGAQSFAAAAVSAVTTGGGGTEEDRRRTSASVRGIPGTRSPPARPRSSGTITTRTTPATSSRTTRRTSTRPRIRIRPRGRSSRCRSRWPPARWRRWSRRSR